jgi:hypothetical protein
MRRYLLAAAAVVLLCGAAPAPEEAATVTHHAVTLAGKPLAYVAEAGRLPIRDPLTGEPRGQMFFVAYRVPVPAGQPPRPVTFVWPGGPDASGAYMHMAYGPRHAEQGRIVDNPNSLLDASDLVFVDPMDSGFSRATSPEAAKEFYSTLGDGAANAEFIRAWRALNGPSGAPVFILGQSYGVWRTSLTMDALEQSGRRVAGVVMISGGVQVGPEATSLAVQKGLLVPHHAATAFAHGKLPSEFGRDRESVMKNAEAWARSVYIPALQRIDQLSPAERDKVAMELARWTAQPADSIDRKTLMYTPNDFRANVLRAEGKVLARYDMRQIDGVKGPFEDANKEAGVAYIRGELGYRTDLAYLGDEPSLIPKPRATWNYNSGKVTPESVARMNAGGGPPGAEPWIASSVKVDPKLKVMIAAGRYDSLNSCTTNDDLHRRMDADLAAHIVMKCYDGGHGIQGDPKTAPELSADIRAFIRTRVAAR